GVAASVGLILTLGAALTVLPAALVLVGSKIPVRPPRVVGLQGWAQRLSRHAGAVLVPVLLLTIPIGYAARNTPFDFSLVNLLPADAESAQLMDRMLNERTLSANAAVVAAPSLSEARALADRLRSKPTVFSVVHPGMFFPEHQQDRLQRLEALDRRIASAASASAEKDQKPQAPTLVDALRALELELENLTDLAMQQKRASAARVLEDALEQVSDLVDQAEAPSVQAGLARFSDALHEAVVTGRQRISSTVKAGPVTADLLPEPLRRRFISPSGRYAVYAVPEHSMWDREALSAFIKDVRSVAPDVTGFPETFYENAGLIQRGFTRAAIYASIAVLVLLAIDLRNGRDVLFAVVPVGLGMVWMIGGIRALGVQYNLANIVGLPLIIGVGIDNGVHLMHRFRESGSMVESMTHTGTAVLLSSLTTMVGFGALSLSSHRGLASMGLMMLLGVGSCLLMAMTALPAALCISERLIRERRAP
ncbi:MAG: MMPL family transporter, partial [Myxococcota bacterium]